MTRPCLSALMCVCTILLIEGCTHGNKRTETSSATKLLGVVHNNDPYWNPRLTAAQQKAEAQTLALLVMYFAGGNAAQDFVGTLGDPGNFSSTDKMLKQLYNADPNHTVYRSVRALIMDNQNQASFASFARDFRIKIFKPLSTAVLAERGTDPYPDNICPTNATVCNGAAGLSTACDIVP